MLDVLVIVDMQVGSFGPDNKRHDSAGLVDRLNGLAARVRAHNGTIVWVQHDGSHGDPARSAIGRMADSAGDGQAIPGYNGQQNRLRQFSRHAFGVSAAPGA